MPRFPIGAAQALLGVLFASMPLLGGEIAGRVEMPSTCSPTVSPAVVSLERLDGKVEPATGRGAKVALVNQKGLQFEPRVQAVQVGQTVQFTNADNETHNVHILTPGVPFNQSMAHGRSADYAADQPGLLRLLCDVHSHMRGFVVVSPTPYFAVCRADGKFRIDDVPDGRYRLHAWHEMGQGATVELAVKDGETVDLPMIRVEAPAVTTAVKAAEVRPWSEVVDRIGVILAEARVAVSKPNGVATARKRIEDAYWEEFEGADMETAVRRHLGFQKAGEVEGQFRGLRSLVKSVGTKETPAAVLADRSRELLLSLVHVSEDLNRLGVTDRSKIGSGADRRPDDATPTSDLATKQAALVAAFGEVARLADAGDAAEASSAMTSAYFDAFDPLERILGVRRPQDVRPLEARFNAIRGEIGEGLKGEALAKSLDSLRADVNGALDRSLAGGTFGPAFVASLVTILREGVEVILLLTMLISLASKAGEPRALRAIRWGVGWAVVASLVTAVGLNRIVASSQGRTREQIEGWVLMAAAAVLYYVSYWLISQSESQKWTRFLKDRINRGVAAGGFGTLTLTAFLAVYREGAETALMYQAMLAGQAGSTLGLLGVGAGLLVGGLALAVIYRLIRATSVRLPLKSFFKVTGFALFAMAVVFAGNGVYELQSAGLLKISPLTWLGTGVPLLGIHPNVQVLAVQALLVGGAVVSLFLIANEKAEPQPQPAPSVRPTPPVVASPTIEPKAVEEVHEHVAV